MPIQDSDLFLIQTPTGESRSIQASVLQAGLDTTFADHFLLVNTGVDGATPSHKVRCSNSVAVVADNSGWLLANSGGASYRVGATAFADYFAQSASGSINQTGYEEYQVSAGANTPVAMPASAAAADIVIAIVYIDVDTTVAFEPKNNFISLVKGEPSSRPTSEVFIHYGPLTGNKNICTTPSYVKNVVVITYELTGNFKLIHSETNGTTTSTNWNNIKATSAQISGVDEYYGVFAVSARPTGASYTGAAPTVANAAEPVTISTMTPGGGSLAKTYTTNKLTAANGEPTYTINPFSFSNRGVGFALFFGAMPPSNRGEVVYSSAGDYQWTCPEGVTSVCVVCVGGGRAGETGSYQAGGGGALAWKNDIPVVPGNQYLVSVGGAAVQSYFIDETTVKASGGNISTYSNFVGDGGGRGAPGWPSSGGASNYGGGGAGGYSGDGGRGAQGGSTAQSTGSPGTGGAGGGGGGYFSGAGGGVGLFGEGNRGAGGKGDSNKSTNGGAGGSGGQRGASYSLIAGDNQSVTGGGLFGGGGSEGKDSKAHRGSNGAVRILWGPGRAFPATDVGPTTLFDVDEPMRQVLAEKKRKLKAGVNYAKEYGIEALRSEVASAADPTDEIVESIKGVDPDDEA